MNRIFWVVRSMTQKILFILSRPAMEATELLRSSALFPYICGCSEGLEHPNRQGSPIHTHEERNHVPSLRSIRYLNRKILA